MPNHNIQNITHYLWKIIGYQISGTVDRKTFNVGAEIKFTVLEFEGCLQVVKRQTMQEVANRSGLGNSWKRPCGCTQPYCMTLHGSIDITT